MRTIRCYSCTTMDADRLLSDVQDQNWRRWLENVRFVPNTEECNDNFAVNLIFPFHLLYFWKIYF